jgi:hypothetical protein
MEYRKIFIVIIIFFVAKIYAIKNESAIIANQVLSKIESNETVLAKSKQLQNIVSNAESLNNTASITASSQSFSPPQNQVKPQINMNNLGGIDSATSDLVTLKRKLEIEKAEAELKKIRGIGINNNNNIQGLSADNVQTTVTGVAINQEGKKIAWLQFTDGGSLTVNIGSQVGTYIVSDITMNGVQLSSGKGKKPTIFLKRAYYAPEKAKQANSNNSRLGFTPSPIVTDANTGNEMVPPIVPIR